MLLTVWYQCLSSFSAAAALEAEEEELPEISQRKFRLNFLHRVLL